MNKSTVIHVRIDGKKIRCSCEDVGHKIEDMVCGCPHCGCDHNHTVVDVLQLGFFEDRGLFVRQCDQCGKLNAFRYSMEVLQETLGDERDDTIETED